MDEDHMQSLVTFIAQLDPRGWIWRNFSYQQHFLRQYMLHVLDVKDALDGERFVQVHFDASAERQFKSFQSGETTEDVSPNGGSSALEAPGWMGSIPAPTLQVSARREYMLQTLFDLSLFSPQPTFSS